MSKSNTFETELLKLIFRNEALLGIGNAGGLQPSLVTGSLHIALYTSDPGEGDTGTEASYSGYSRVSVVRSAAGWVVVGDECSNVADVVFPTSAGPTQTVTHFGIRTLSTGGDLLYSGSLLIPSTINNGDTVKFNANSLIITED